MARKLNKNLIALGSAAVVIVYGAGYARTQSAANQIDGGTSTTPPAAASVAPAASVTHLTAPTVSAAIAQALASATPATSGTTAATQQYRVRYGDTLSSIAARFGTTVTALQTANGLSGTEIRSGERLLIAAPSAAEAAVQAATPTSQATRSNATSVAAPAQATAPTAAPRSNAVAATTGNAVTAPVTATATSGFKNGVFNGAGSNRFGEIDVAVMIQNGRIANVQITRATTHYPVSRIAQLPGEVLSRQSAQVDFVSGATNSARAFIDAVTQALSQAQNGAGTAAAPVSVAAHA